MGSGQRSIASFFGAGKRSSPRLKPSPSRQKGRASPARALDLEAGSEPPTAAATAGQRLRVFWPAEKAWFEGRVGEVQERKGKRRAYVAYDDGDEEWVDLERDRFEVLEPGRKRARAKAAQVLDSDSEAEPSASQGSEFLASEEEGEESDDDSVSMAASEAEEEESEAESDVKPARKPAGGKTASAAAKASPGAGAAAGRKRVSSATTQATPCPASQSRGGLPPATPASGLRPAARNLAEALETPSFATPATSGPAATPGSALGGALSAGPSERFGVRATSRFPFLRPDRVRDAEGRRPGDPGYDPTTLFLPPTWLHDAKISEGQRQWWAFKAANFDAVLLFKMGKFYELFEMDAHVGVELLGLTYMRGEQPHAGFPEAAYAGMAATLARAGVKVVVIEQTETPEALAARNEKRRQSGQKKVNVVRREKVAVLTPGTLTDAEMVSSTPDPTWLLVLVELESTATAGVAHDGPPGRVPASLPGASPGPGAACDPLASPAQLSLGAVAVDVASARLRAGQWAEDELRGGLRALLCTLRPAEVVIAGALSAPSARVVRGMLPGALVEDQVLALAEVEALDVVVGSGSGETGPGVDSASNGDACMQGPRPAHTSHLAMDAAALENLEVLEGGEGGAGTHAGAGLAGSLLAAVDHCVTPGGRGAMRAWLARPLFDPGAIRARQDARAVVRLAAAGLGLGPARDAPRVVLYEDTARRRVRGVAATLRGLRRIQDAVAQFQGVDGVDADFDAATRAIVAADAALDDYLEEVKGLLKTRAGVTYVSLNKDSHVLQLPEVFVGVASVTTPASWEPMTAKKGVRRYTNTQLRALVKRREAAHEARVVAQAGILVALLRRFAEHQGVWSAAVECSAQLDALLSLAVAAGSSAGPMCRPEILPWSDVGGPMFEAKDLRHPVSAVMEAAAMSSGGGGGFVPNDVSLGADAPPFLVLTGPNMGGKSTLMRQICLAVVLAQVGAWVPAASLRLTPADSLFVRMGARDRLLLGQSTFFVEMAETSAALARATRHSLVALDELGRGTATSDGAAIAGAVLEHLASDLRCRGLFATHYHAVAEHAQVALPVAVCHMACRVDGDGGDHVTFLYKLVPGACPASYGVNVARLAGLPDAVVRRASSMAASLAQGATIDGEEGAREKLGSILEACRRGPKAVQAAWLSMRRPAISV
ncbi:DNA mismatch repair protein Msh6 [Auxenochlorella protothecoides]|uniref:DNA mismatch repair protein n=1 Tax=Auxenochlorella protothecoides TaxID=3075 RepID=A0A087SQY4_AUXPR|nr:DNA mismatch repair protein Msh6 [Auxenochlorella protothecoides]KFM28138.1 DNA mismatch repair protein Msh6 [Auxenochlorella protothecoides]